MSRKELLCICLMVQKQGRVDYIFPADYSKDSKMETTVFAIVDQIKAYNTTLKLHLSDMDAASKIENH